MYVYSLLQHYKTKKPDKEETVFRTKKCAYSYTPFFNITRTGSQTIHTASSVEKKGSHTIHTAPSASQKMGTRQVTHTHVHTRTHTHARARVRARTHTILNTINSIARSGIQTVKTQSIFSNTRTRCQTFGYELSSPSVDLRRYFHCSHVALEQLSEQHAGLLFLVVNYIDILATQEPPTSDRHLQRPF